MDNEFSVGTIFQDRYEVVEKLSRSRVGTLYTAVDRTTSKQVIVKIFSHRFIPGEKSLHYLESTLKYRQKFSHPNLIRILDSFRLALDAEKETLAIVLEKVGGVTLTEAIRQRTPGARTVFDAIHGLLQIADAMEYLHEQKIEVVPLHPRRIHLSPGEVKISPFGFFTSAEWIRDGSKWGCTTGVDFRYVAPEMIDEGSFLAGGAHADRYLLGIVAYEFLVGAPPYEANRETLMQLQRTEPIPENLLPDNLPLWFVELLRGLLAKNPENRPTLSQVRNLLRQHLQAEQEILERLLLPVEGTFVRVLFVGDNRLDQLSVARMAKSERLPFHYRIAQTIEKAEEILEHREVDVIVTDHLLPDGTSFDLIRSGNMVPVIVITGSEKKELKEAVLKAGAFACLTKDLRQAHLKTLPGLLVKAHKREP